MSSDVSSLVSQPLQALKYCQGEQAFPCTTLLFTSILPPVAATVLVLYDHGKDISELIRVTLVNVFYRQLSIWIGRSVGSFGLSSLV
jgi:hypothetical protein